MASAPPTIFSRNRRSAARTRLAALQQHPSAARFVADDVVEDMLERLAFTRHRPARALLIGDWSGGLTAALAAQGCTIASANVPGAADIDEEAPFPQSGFDLIASLSGLDTVNDLPGALIHMRRALAPGGMMLASLPGAGSLPVLRRIMQAADGERPAGRVHPLVDVRAGAQLVQRAGFADPVADGRSITVAWRSLDAMVADLRAQGLGNQLARPAPAYGKAWLERARQAFAAEADAQGRVVETIEILTLSGRG
jgi:SAM-dependent methyltransferase